MPSKERLLDAAVPLADFAQHPADRLVDQVVRVAQQRAGDGERVVVRAGLDVRKGREDGDAPIPDAGRSRQLSQDPTIPAAEVGADDVLGRQIDQIPSC